MIFRSIYLTNEDYEFLKRTRHLCHYLEREILRKIKFHADFRRVCVQLAEGAPPPTVLNSSDVLCVYLQYDPKHYQNLRDRGETVEFFIDMITQGLEKCQPGYRLPMEELLAGIAIFREGDYQNEWTHKRRYFKERKVRAALDCRLTMDNFELTLKVERDGKMVYDSVILNTDPDEIAFDYRFRDIKIQRGRLIVTSKTSEPLISISMRDLKKAIENEI